MEMDGTSAGAPRRFFPTESVATSEASGRSFGSASAAPTGGVTVAPERSLRRALARAGGIRIRVAGECMHPTLSRGDWVWIQGGTDPRPGDVVLLEASGRPEIHRLLARIRVGNRTWYVHAGDASDLCGVASLEEILGRVEVRARRPRPAPMAHVLGLGLRLGGLFWHLGLYPGRRATGRLAGAIRRAAARLRSSLFIVPDHKSG